MERYGLYRECVGVSFLFLYSMGVISVTCDRLIKLKTIRATKQTMRFRISNLVFIFIPQTITFGNPDDTVLDV